MYIYILYTYIYVPPKQILNTGLTITQNHSTLNTMKTTQNYLKNTGQ